MTYNSRQYNNNDRKDPRLAILIIGIFIIVCILVCVLASQKKRRSRKAITHVAPVQQIHPVQPMAPNKLPYSNGPSPYSTAPNQQNFPYPSQHPTAPHGQTQMSYPSQTPTAPNEQSQSPYPNGQNQMYPTLSSHQPSTYIPPQTSNTYVSPN